MSSAEVCLLLERHGFSRARQRGSHIVMQGVFAGRTRTAVVPERREIERGTLHRIVKQSGLDRSLFEVE
jgi:predicted RNA binding protein YcfA (HicA-like mRNA interferase family)